MRWIDALRARLRLLRRADAERRMDEEMRFHLDMLTEQFRREGHGPEEARRRAALAFGGLQGHRETMRDGRTLAWLGGLSLDFRLGLRMLAKHPGLTATGVLGMAVAIAIGATVFSALGTVFSASLPLPGGERVVVLQNQDVAGRGPAAGTHLHDLADWRAEVSAVEALGAYRAVDRNLFAPDGAAEPLRTAEITASGFRVAGVPPLLGRWLDPADERPGAPSVVVIGHDVWRDRFAGRPDVVGRTLRLGDEPHTVVGVMPEGFAFPVNHGIWTPLRLDPSASPRGEAPAVEVFGRLAPGVTLEQAQAQLSTVGRRLAAAHPESHERLRPRVLPFTRAMWGSAGLPWDVYLFQLLISLLLVVVAVNVASLVYARTATRSGEIAVRLALGARRVRIVAQLFAEALVLCAAAAAVGLLAAHFALRGVGAFVARVGGEEVPFWWQFRLSPATAMYVVGLAVLAAGIVGVVPALRMTGGRSGSDLRRLGGGTGARMGRTWTVLIVGQVAVAVTILPLAIALGWNEFFRAGSGGPGFAAEQLLSARIGLGETPADPRDGPGRGERARRFADRQAELERRLEAEPGVAAVTWASHLPGGLPGGFFSGGAGMIEVERSGPAAEGARHPVTLLQVDPGLFDAFGVPVLAGRGLRPSDPADAARAVVVSRGFVERALGGGAALGRRFRYERVEDDREPGGGERGTWYEIVGVVSDFPAKKAVDGMGIAAVYHPAAPGTLDPVSLFVRVRGVDPDRFAARLREATLAVDPTLRLSRVQAMGQLERQKLRAGRLLTLGIATVMGSVLLLSAAGIHALMSFTVARRRREIGIRTALGAQPRRILRSVFARALTQLGLGVAVGATLGGALMWGEGFSPARVAALLLAVAAVVLAVGLLAALGPARRGLRVHPVEALRADG